MAGVTNADSKQECGSHDQQRLDQHVTDVTADGIEADHMQCTEMGGNGADVRGTVQGGHANASKIEQKVCR